MKKMVKYLSNGEYKYATVKDIGDIDKLETTAKDDLVSAINEINKTGGAGSDSQQKIDELTSDMSDVKKSVSEASKNIDSLTKDFNESNDTLSTSLNNLKDSTTDSISKVQAELSEHNDSIKTINDKAQALDASLTDTKESLKQAKTDIETTKIGQQSISSTVDTLKNEMSTKVEKTALDDVQEQVQKNTVNITTNSNGLNLKANKEDLDLANQNIAANQADLKIQANQISGMVSKDSVTQYIDDFDVKKINLLLGTKDWYNWNISNSAYIRVTDEQYNHCFWASITKTGESINLDVSGLVIGNTYTLSIVGKTLLDGDTVQITGGDKIGILSTDDGSKNISTTIKTYHTTFVATSETMNIPFGIIGNVSTNNSVYINQAKLETGGKVTYWEMNPSDNYERIQHSEAKLEVFDNQITTLTKTQTEMEDTQKELSTSFSQLDDKVTLTQNNLTKTNQDVKDVSTKIDSKAGELTATLKEEINSQISEISDSSANLILNSAFTSNTDHWQSISTKSNIVSDSDNKKWLELKQNGLTADSTISIESNYFAVKNNDVLTIAFDLIKKTDITLDNETILVLEVFNTSNTRVDFKELGIGDFSANGTDVVRLKYKYVINHSDAAKFALRPELKRNGHIWLSNFLAMKSSISNGDYVANTQDNLDVQVLQQAQITANTNGLALTATKDSVNTLSGTVSKQSSQLSVLSNQMDQKTSKTDFDTLTGRVSNAEQKIQANADGVTSTVSKVSGLQEQVNNSGSPNLILNSNFATGDTTHWGLDAYSNLDESVVYQGTPSMKIKTSGATTDVWAYFSTDRRISVSEGDVISFGAYLKSEDVDVLFYIELQCFPDSTSSRNNIVRGEGVSGTHDWVLRKGTYTVTSEVKYVKLHFYMERNGTGWMSRPILVKASSLPSYSPSPEDNATVTALNVVKQTADETYQGLFNSDGSNRIDSTAQSTTQQINSTKTELQTYANTQATNAKNSAISTASSDATTKANNALSSAKSYADSSSNTLKTDYTNKISNTSSEFTQKLSAVQTQVDNSAVGTQLIVGTGNSFTMGYGISNTTWQDGWAYLDLTKNTIKKNEILPQSASWNLTNGYIPTNGVTYTQSIYIKTDATLLSATAAKWTWFTTKGHNQQATTLEKIGTNLYRLYGSYKWSVDDTYLRIFDISNLDSALDIFNTGTYLAFQKPKLEKGSVATDYSLAPSEQATTAYTQTLVDAKAGELSLSLQKYSDTSSSNALSSAKSYSDSSSNNALTNAKSYADTTISAKAGELSATLKSYTDTSINNISIGGTNLIPLSNIAMNNATQTAYDSTNDIRTLTVVNGAGGSWGGGILNNAATRHEIPWGQSFTYSVEIMPLVSGLTWNSDTNSFPISGSSWGGNDNDAGGLRKSGGTVGGIGATLTANVWNKVWVTYINSNSSNTNKVSLYDNSTFGVVNSTGSTVTVKFRHFKGEIGNTPTDWCLADEDIKNDATNKANSALSSAKSYSDTQLTAKAGTLTAATNAADYHNLISMDSNGILLDAHGVSNSNKSIILSGDHVKIDSSNPVLIPNAAIGTLTGKTITGSTITGGTLTSTNTNGYSIMINDGTINLKSGNTVLGTIDDVDDRLFVGSSTTASNFGFLGAKGMTTGMSTTNGNLILQSTSKASEGYSSLELTDSGKITGTANGDLNISTNGAHDAIFGSKDANVGLWGNILYFDRHSDSKRLFVVTDNYAEIFSTSVYAAGVHLVNGNAIQATTDTNFYIDGTSGGGGSAILHVQSVQQSSLLSLKTNINAIDPENALDKISQTKIYEYQYKRDVERGSNKRYASYIIDDVNDVAQYTEPEEFLSEDKKGRDDGSLLAYAVLAIQELKKEIEDLKSQINK